MPTIQQVSRFIRSKNAGPFWITIDIFCSDKESYDSIMQSMSLTPDELAKIYDVDAQTVKIYPVPNLLVIKISIPRKLPQGHKYERDMHSGQQYVRILDLEL